MSLFQNRNSKALNSEERLHTLCNQLDRRLRPYGDGRPDIDLHLWARRVHAMQQRERRGRP